MRSIGEPPRSSPATKAAPRPSRVRSRPTAPLVSESSFGVSPSVDGTPDRGGAAARSFAQALGGDQRGGGEDDSSAAISDQHRMDRRRHWCSRVTQRLGAVPGVIPIGAARNVEWDQQRRPGRKAANAVRYDAGARSVAKITRRRLVGAIAADESEVDQGRDPQAHMIEPDQHTQPVVGEQTKEHGQAEIVEIDRR